jgi:hypothetical protein
LASKNAYKSFVVFLYNFENPSFLQGQKTPPLFLAQKRRKLGEKVPLLPSEK